MVFSGISCKRLEIYSGEDDSFSDNVSMYYKEIISSELVL